MPRKPRIDAPGLVHHVIVRGIERRDIFVDDADKWEFLERISKYVGGKNNQLYAFVLMPNHIHFLIRTLELPLSSCMRRLLTGYALYFNRRHKRAGHLFQNRYKSFVVDEEVYLLELIRYIHLNPLRARLCVDLDTLAKWPFSGHASLVGRAFYPWYEVVFTLSLFGSSYAVARTRLTKFMQEGLVQGRRDDLAGGGLKRSLNAMSASERTSVAIYDERILGCSSFAEAVLAKLENSQVHPAEKSSLDEFIKQVASCFNLTFSELCSGTKRHAVVKARAAAIWLGTKRYGFSTTELSDTLSISRTRVYEVLNSGIGEMEGNDIEI